MYVALQVDERLLALVADVRGLVGVLGGAGELADLGGDGHRRFDAESTEHAGEHALGAAVAVDVGVVEVVDALVERVVDAARRLRPRRRWPSRSALPLTQLRPPIVQQPRLISETSMPV